MPYDMEPRDENGGNHPGCPVCGFPKAVSAQMFIHLPMCGVYSVQVLACPNCKFTKAGSEFSSEIPGDCIQGEGEEENPTGNEKPDE